MTFHIISYMYKLIVSLQPCHHSTTALFPPSDNAGVEHCDSVAIIGKAGDAWTVGHEKCTYNTRHTTVLEPMSLASLMGESIMHCDQTKPRFITYKNKNKYFTDITHHKIVQNVRVLALIKGHISCDFYFYNILEQ